jgi:hypothetical protein
MPSVCLVSNAYCGQASRTGQPWHTDFALRMVSTSTPVSPAGKKRSTATDRHPASSRHLGSFAGRAPRPWLIVTSQSLDIVRNDVAGVRGR